jgi:hypothetical protein
MTRSQASRRRSEFLGALLISAIGLAMAAWPTARVEEPLPDGTLAFIRGADPSSSRNEVVDCTQYTVISYNDINSPPPPPGFAVGSNDCAGNNGCVCLSCPVNSASVTVNNDRVNNGWVPIGQNVDCNGAMGGGKKGTCANGVCINQANYSCFPMPIYQLQS